jgi:hypothetical protein
VLLLLLVLILMPVLWLLLVVMLMVVVCCGGRHALQLLLHLRLACRPGVRDKAQCAPGRTVRQNFLAQTVDLASFATR